MTTKKCLKLYINNNTHITHSPPLSIREIICRSLPACTTSLSRHARMRKGKTFYLPEMCKHDGKNEFRNKMKHKRFLFTLQCSGNCECVRQKRKNLKSIENNELSQYCRNITHTGRGGKRILQTCIRSHLSLLNRAATNKIAIRMKIQFRTLSRKCESYQKHF